jgi:hypothetical protein
MRYDAGPHLLRIGFIGCARVETIDIPSADIPYESTLTDTFSETHDQRPITSGLPRGCGIQAHKTRVADQIQIRELTDDLCGKECRAIPIHRISVVDGHIHIFDITKSSLNTIVKIYDPRSEEYRTVIGE